MILQVIRRFVQVGTLLLLASIALLSLYAHYRSARVIDDPDLMAGMRGETITQLIHPFVESLDDPQQLLDDNKGTLWSMKFMGLDITDPLAAAEMIAASKHIHWPLLVSIAIPVLVTLLLGRVFCSWICPGYLLFELTTKLRKLLHLAEIKTGDVRFSHNSKYIVLLVGLGVTVVTSAPIFALIYPPAVISRAIHAAIFGTALTGMLLILGAIVAIELFVSPRWWCRVICPGGALYGLLGWARIVRVKLKKEACTGCLDCIAVCEAGINPITQSASIECDNCGVCLRHCGDQALYYKIGLPDLRSTSRKANKKHARRLPGLAVVVYLLMLATPQAQAHHILGLPHYSYKSNYPQRPTLEYPATTGPYDVLLTSYPGVPVPGKPANLAFYIKNRMTHAVYEKPVSVRILQTHTFGDNTEIMPTTTRIAYDKEYKFYVTLPDVGEYVIELSLLVEGKMEVIPFLMTAGQPSAMASVGVLGAFGVVFLFVVVRAIQMKKKRRAGLTIVGSKQPVALSV